MKINELRIGDRVTCDGEHQPGIVIKLDKDSLDLELEKSGRIMWVNRLDRLKFADKNHTDNISDGYHTFGELYNYRMLYNAGFANELAKREDVKVCKSHRHSDGEECFGGGWFIVMIELPTGQISNHYENKYWDLFQVPELEKAWEWDGHSPQEAADRLLNYLKMNMEQKSTPLGRMLDEQRELEEKNSKLNDFIDTKMDEVVTDEYQKQMLKLQSRVMSRYIDILSCRMGRMDGSPEAQLNFMTFGEAIEVLRNGGAIRRAGWNGKGLFVIKQVPAFIGERIIPNMQSLPQVAKNILMSREDKKIVYTNQMLIIHPDGRADSWVPSSSDVFATDWEVVVK